MKLLEAATLCVFAACIFLNTGCQQLACVFHQPSDKTSVLAGEARSPFRLAAYTDGQQPERSPASQPATSQPATSAEETPKPTTQPIKPLPYTAPGMPYRQMSLVAVAAGFVMLPEVAGAGREAAESLILAPEGIVGRAGLTAPSTILGNVIVGRPGLIEGPATGLSFASQRNNIFKPTFNPMSGPQGRCQDLANAGFFGGGRGRCENHFRR